MGRSPAGSRVAAAPRGKGPAARTEDGQGALRHKFDVKGDWLEGRFEQDRGEGGPGSGFGSEGMRFRLAQVGGEMVVRLDEKTYSLTLRMALRSYSDLG